mmetsp:Transcript_2619/g.7230  ORF Transcript_2619/g.7230 Transcript_2619/m.7230 type:complete len:237 (+) Transcript_2619:162-872(+)|eukprot:CAMPEP_0119120698 /NCGR_PEP_ID=MMETSP1310-20130426/1631_1 /TAXON_ID=464262 /ORGANISM="Genus nov. species nov., Strain RCC2339" /LENGTH=236 /DNA_ID=CAMNT_0007110193 /DNA_START=134 /DNA_END=844 /DNA_ORIENTATION=+
MDTGRNEKDDAAIRQQVMETLMDKLGSPEGIQDALITLLTEVNLMKRNFQKETQSRLDLEMTVETELSELNRRLLLEVSAREQQKEDIQSGVQVKQSLIGELDSLKTKLQFLIELISPPVPKNKGKDMFDLLSLTEEMEGQLMEMNDLLNLELSSVSLTRNIREIKDQIDSENKARQELESKTWSLEIEHNNILQAMEEEKAEIAQMQKNLNAEITARKNLEKTLADMGISSALST